MTFVPYRAKALADFTTDHGSPVSAGTVVTVVEGLPIGDDSYEAYIVEISFPDESVVGDLVYETAELDADDLETLSPEDDLVDFLEKFGQIDALEVALRGNDPKLGIGQRYTILSILREWTKGMTPQELVYHSVLVGKKCLAEEKLSEGIFRIRVRRGVGKEAWERSKHFKLPWVQ